MRSTAITIPWADGEYTFDLPLKEVEALEDETGYGVSLLLARLQAEHHRSREPRLTILWGLIGGGMEAAKARNLVKLWVDDRPGKERNIPAQAVLLAWHMGAPTPKKATRPKKKTGLTTAPVGSTSGKSTE